MTEITTESDLEKFFEQERAILFIHAPWSQYSVISRQMIEFVERYAKAGQRDVLFFFGEFEGERAPLTGHLVAAGVPASAYCGNGSLSFFQRGQHICTLNSVIGEGTFAVWRHIDELLGKTSVKPTNDNQSVVQ